MRYCERLGIAAGLLLAAICLPLAAAASAELPQGADGVVAFCFDGDTVKLTDRRIIRIAGIDAPEMGRDNGRPQYYAREAKKILSDRVRGQKVRLFMVGTGKDRYGRTVADVRLTDGQSLSDIMIGEGAAFFYPHKDLLPELQERLLALQKTAIQERRGMWEQLLTLPLARQNFIGNRASMRFFPATCQNAQHIKPRNRLYFGTLMDAFLAGFAPARVCPFWPEQF